MKSVEILFLSIIFPFVIYARENRVTINYSDKQGAFKDYSFSSCNYFERIGDEILCRSGIRGQSETKNARYLFKYPYGFKNDETKEIILETEISKIHPSKELDAVISVGVPDNSYTSKIRWNGFMNGKDLYYYKNGTSIFQKGIGTENTSPIKFNLLIYNENSSDCFGQVLNNFDLNSDSFTFFFHPVVGGIKTHSAKTHNTYKGTTSENELLETPSITSISSSIPSISSNWNRIANASAGYKAFNCSNQRIATMTSDCYTVKGLNSGTTYGYKVKALNSNKALSFSEYMNFVTGGCLVNLLIDSDIINSSKTYEAANSIEILESKFEPNSATTVQAGNIITISPQTHFKYGAVVNLKIGECSSANEFNRNLASKNEENVFEKIKTAKTIPSNLLHEHKFDLPTDEFDILVFPNPFDDYLKIKIPKDFLGGELTFYNVLHQTLWKKDKLNKEFEILNVEQLPSGLYFLKATIRNKTTILKVLRDNK